MRSFLDDELVAAHRARALSPDHPVLRGSAQNPDVFFQAREAANPFYAAVPGIVARELDRFAERTGRRYRLFDYTGDPDAERVLVLMGSAAGAAAEAVEALCARGERVGLLTVRLFRPFARRRVRLRAAGHDAVDRGARPLQGARPRRASRSSRTSSRRSPVGSTRRLA